MSRIETASAERKMKADEALRAADAALEGARATLKEREDGLARAQGCDVLLAWLPSASMGTAIEMHEAARAGALVLTVTPMAANWVVRTHSDRIFADLAELEAFLASPEAAELLAVRRGGD